MLEACSHESVGLFKPFSEALRVSSIVAFLVATLRALEVLHIKLSWVVGNQAFL